MEYIYKLCMTQIPSRTLVTQYKDGVCIQLLAPMFPLSNIWCVTYFFSSRDFFGVVKEQKKGVLHAVKVWLRVQ